jgi:AraC-like DNA-binding protein
MSDISASCPRQGHGRNYKNMDKTIRRPTGRAEPITARPVIVLANWFQFGPGERAVRPRVESRMLLWCRAGKGRLRINGDDSEFLPGDWVLLPWKHTIVYEADSVDPFFVGGVHVIPAHDASIPVKFLVAHRGDDAIADHPGRRDAPWPDLQGTVRRRFFAANDPLALLSRYIVERFRQSTPCRQSMERLAMSLIDELTQAVQRQPNEQRQASTLLQRMRTYAESHLERPLSIGELAGSVGCSEATVYRCFHEHAGVSPGQWLTRLRAERAAALLTTTTLAVRAVGERVGLTDPFHFSRLFKRAMGVSPRAYRDSKRVL